jgi:predicted RNase H-like HicB family nuclease
MKKKFLVVYEHGKRNYGGFAPDVPGCVSTGKTIDQMRHMMKEPLEAHLAWMAVDGDPMPLPSTKTIDFSTFEDPTGEVDHYVVEWLEVEVPVSSHKHEALTA